MTRPRKTLHEALTAHDAAKRELYADLLRTRLGQFIQRHLLSLTILASLVVLGALAWDILRHVAP